MHVDLEDRHGSGRKTVAWIPYALLTTLSAITLAGFAYLHSTGWGITIDLKKLADAFVVSGKYVDGTDSSPPAETNLIANNQQPAIAQQPRNTQSIDNYHQTSGERPLTWSVQLAKFNEVFIQHPACDPSNMKWPQMECSNFRARAMKRFQKEWSNNSYWNGQQIVNNEDANKSVNNELKN